MMIRLLRLNIKVLIGRLKGVPVLGILFLCALAAGAVFALVTLSLTHKYYVFVGIFSALLIMHLSRKDYHFCEKLLPCPFAFFAVEYSAVSIPFAVLSAFRGDLILCVLYALASPLIALLPQPKVLRRESSSPLMLTMPSLEATSFFRRYRPLIWIMYAASFALTFANGVSMLLLYLLMLFYAGSSFSQGESISLLCVQAKASRAFLNSKILQESFFWIKLSLPVVALYLCFNIDTAYIALIPILLGPMLIAACIFIKYANYIPSKELPGTALQALCLLGYLIPLLLPLSLIMTVAYYRAAVDTLKPYLDDFYREP